MRLDGTPLLDPEEILNCFREVQEHDVRVELYLDKDKRPHNTSVAGVVPPPAAGENPSPHIQLTPMEPASGNRMIRQARLIRLAFFMGEYSLLCKVAFQGLALAGGQRVLEVSPPEIVKVTQRRTSVRYKVPDDIVIPASITKKSAPICAGRLEDITLKGLSVKSPAMNPPLAVFDRVKISIRIDFSLIPPPPELGDKQGPHADLFLFGEVRFAAQVRVESDSTNPKDHVADIYGIDLGQPNPQQRALILVLSEFAREAYLKVHGEEIVDDGYEGDIVDLA